MEKVLQIVESQLCREDFENLARLMTHLTAVQGVASCFASNPADQAGGFLSFWDQFSHFDGQQASVRVFNPGFESHGWQSDHTLVQVLANDMPFQVDSVRMLLNEGNQSIKSMLSAVVCVERNAQGEVIEVKPDCKTQDSGTRVESCMIIEVNRLDSQAELEKLRDNILDVLAEVQKSVEGYEPMKRRMSEIIEKIRSDGFNLSDDKSEVLEFLDWLLADHFTFLGYSEFDFHKTGEAVDFVHNPDRDMGVCQGDFNTLIADGRQLPRWVLDNLSRPEYLSFSKGFHRARVHRSVYPDFIGIREFDTEGNLRTMCRFVGLFTAPVYTHTPRDIPIVRQKIINIIRRTGLSPLSHYYRDLGLIFETLPREELFQATEDHLHEVVMGLLALQDNQKTALFMRRDSYGRFWSCLVYMSRDVYNTHVRMQVQQMLAEALNASGTDFYTYLSDSPMARTHFILSVDPTLEADVDQAELENRLLQLTSNWQDELQASLRERFSESISHRLVEEYQQAFSSAYREDFPARSAMVDVEHMEAVSEAEPLQLSLYRPPFRTDDGHLHLKLYYSGALLPLSEVMPVIENMGMKVLQEVPYRVKRADGKRFHIQAFRLQPESRQIIDIVDINKLFCDAFKAVWTGKMADGHFNRLIIPGKIPWRQVALIRAYAHYMHQIRFGFSLNYVATVLRRHLPITLRLLDLFALRFDPDMALDKPARDRLADELLGEINAALDDVSSLDDDRILRLFVMLIQATQRTNFYQYEDGDGDGDVPRETIALKLQPAAIPEVPRPAPMFEIFVYAPDVEGVHLRGGKVARGGLRWSDRYEDFRTEVLGLVKAQQVKNSVIVPMGSKGGFVVRDLPSHSDRDAFMAAGIAGYRKFVAALLDVTDNLVSAEMVPPARTVRHDEDDPYLVVAADKGTATFSDIANEIACRRGFWLGDAFASGGSNGYDHKSMGITARGAWESVKRLFRERGLDVQKEPFTVVGVGDMAGDVFGNGMLLSDKICLVAAFNHMHIFIDPNPDPALSFQERKRLFEMPRSTWADYNSHLISTGGGVFSRAAKSVPVSPEMKARFDIQADKLPPAALLTALLKAPVDLFWNGGIGTYIKAGTESHQDVGDKSNDGIRVNGRELRFRVLGEGGNLGATQLGRIEFGRHGGLSNTDFIDNAGGVDCSDHEVNIKILLGRIVENGDMTEKQRNHLLEKMTDDVAALVLKNNYRQVQCISLLHREGPRRLEEYRRFVNAFEAEGKLDRTIEFLPSDEEFLERAVAGEGLTRPELSTLISYSKNDLKERIARTTLPDDPEVMKEMFSAFPDMLLQKYPDDIGCHPLRKQLVATQLANDMVNRMGLLFAWRLETANGATLEDIGRAYIIARESLDIPYLWNEIESLDGEVDVNVQMDMMVELIRLTRRGVTWLLRNSHGGLDTTDGVERFLPLVRYFKRHIETVLPEFSHRIWLKEKQQWLQKGVPEALADRMSALRFLLNQFGVVDLCDHTGRPMEEVSGVMLSLSAELKVQQFYEQLDRIDISDIWNSLAREGFRDDLDHALRTMTLNVLAAETGETDLDERIRAWSQGKEVVINRWLQCLQEMVDASSVHLAMFSVSLGALSDLANRQG
jgi:glutamate dehydrogenase